MSHLVDSRSTADRAELASALDDLRAGLVQ